MIKNIFNITTFILIFVSCSSPKYRKALVEADSIASVEPKHSMAILDSIGKEMQIAPEEEQMYYRLLCIKAADKSRIKQKSDTAILQLVKYYETKGDKRLLPEVYYYAGRTYLHLNDAPRSSEYYHKALGVISDENISLKSTLLFQIGRLALNQALYDQAIDMYKEALKCNIALDEKSKSINTMRDIAYTYSKIGEKDSCLTYYNMACKQAEKINNTAQKINVVSQMASFYIEEGDYTKAKECLQPALVGNDSLNISPNHTMALKICMATGQYDSAHYYATELLDIGSVYSRQTASRCLTELSLMRKDYDSATKYLHLFQEYTDSVKKITATEAVNKMNALYNYNLRETENLLLKAENSRKMSFIIIAVSVALVIAVMFLMYIMWNRLRQKQQAERVKRLKKELFEQSEEYIQKNNRKLSLLEEELRRMADKNHLLAERIEEQRADLLLANEQARMKQRRIEAARTRIMSADIYMKIQDYATHGKVMTPTDWKELDSMINREVDGFRTKLYGYYEISRHEYNVCMLIRLGFSPKQIAALLGCTASSVSKIRKRLQEKLFNDSGSAKDFDAFINSL